MGCTASNAMWNRLDRPAQGSVAGTRLRTFTAQFLEARNLPATIAPGLRLESGEASHRGKKPEVALSGVRDIYGDALTTNAMMPA